MHNLCKVLHAQAFVIVMLYCLLQLIQLTQSILHIVTMDNFTVVLAQLFLNVFLTHGCVMVTEIVQIMLMRLHVVCNMITSIISHILSVCTF